MWSGSTWYYEWDVMLPPGLTSFTFPRIPEDLGAWLPPPGTLGTRSVKALDVSTVTGYAAFKATYSTFGLTLPEAGGYTVRASTGFAPY